MDKSRMKQKWENARSFEGPKPRQGNDNDKDNDNTGNNFSSEERATSRSIASMSKKLGERRSEPQNGIQQMGSKSIFYDPDWNPQGEAPPGHKNVPYNPKTFTRKGDSLPPQLAGLQDIGLPSNERKSCNLSI